MSSKTVARGKFWTAARPVKRRRTAASCRRTSPASSGSYKFDLRAQYVADGAEARGFWREATRGSSGAASGRIVGQGFAGASEAKGFSGRFKLHAGPRKLIFTFWPEDGKPARVHASIARKSLPATGEGPRNSKESRGNVSLKLLN